MKILCGYCSLELDDIDEYIIHCVHHHDFPINITEEEFIRRFSVLGGIYWI